MYFGFENLHCRLVVFASVKIKAGPIGKVPGPIRLVFRDVGALPKIRAMSWRHSSPSPAALLEQQGRTEVWLRRSYRMISPSKRTPAEDRGQIQAGRTEDKTPGFDPAAAPLETDAEAGDAANPARPATRHEAKFTNQASFANAMRRPENASGLHPGRKGPVLVIAAAVVLAAAAILLAALLG
jgi:hypothetical protein